MSNKLKELRNEKGYTQGYMAKKAGISIPTYCLYETRQRDIPLDIAECVAELLNVDINDIFSPVKLTISKKQSD